jgi:hypothetical protein
MNKQNINNFYTTVEGHVGFSKETQKWHGKITAKLDGVVISETTDFIGFSDKQKCLTDLGKIIDQISKELGLKDEVN